MKRILIVSDDAGMVKLASDVLSFNGKNHIVAATTFERAEEEIAKGKIIVDVAILDFACANENEVFMQIYGLLNFLDQTNSNYKVVAMFDDRMEERVTNRFKADRKIKKPGVRELREI